MCGESHKISSGFGRYTREILTALYNSGKYEIAELSCYDTGDSPSDVPWKVYPNAVNDQHPESQAYKSHPINQFGQWRFDKTILHFKPDIVFDIRDYWMFAYQELSPLKKYFNWVIAPTIDSIPQQIEWLKTFQNADLVLTHTDWAKKYLESLGRPINVGPCVTDSVNPEIFKPISLGKKYHKMQYGIPTESIIIGSVMRNQKRKLIPALFASLRQLIDETNNTETYLYLHTSYPETSGWNIPELLQEFNVANNVLFTYYCPENGVITVSTYRGPKMPCPKNPGFTSVFPSVVKGLPDEKLAEIYNLFDIYVQYAICEGLGIPQLEAAACGIPIFAVNYSGMEEITSKVNGTKINYVLSRELETGADRAIPDNNHLITEIKNWINLSNQEKKLLSKSTRDLLVKNYSWNKTAEIFMNIFDSLPNKDNWDEPMSVNPQAVVPENLNNRDFVNFIVDHILLEPKLKNSHLVQSLIKGLDETFIQNNGGLNTINRQDVIKNLEVIMNNKMFCEAIRSGQAVLTDSYLNY